MHSMQGMNGVGGGVMGGGGMAGTQRACVRTAIDDDINTFALCLWHFGICTSLRLCPTSFLPAERTDLRAVAFGSKFTICILCATH